jgi:hypothetical protein
MGHERSFGDFMCDVNLLIKDNKQEHNAMGRSIRSIDFTVEEISPNDDYFKKCYKSGMTPEEAIESLADNNDELFRRIKDIPSKFILDEVHNRCMIYEVLSETDTDDLENELLDRWDSSLVKLYDVDDEELIDELSKRGLYSTTNSNGVKAIICEALGFSNSYAYSKEDILAEIEKRL